MSNLTVIEVDGVFVVDSRLIADRLDIDHKSFMDIVVRHFGYPKHSMNILDLLGIKARFFTYSDFEKGDTLNQIINEILYDPAFPSDLRANLVWMFAAIKFESAKTWCVSVQELGGVHPWFKKNHKMLVPNSELIKVVAKNKKRPDFVLTVGGKAYPVECKIDFTSKSLKQLQSYMKLWDCNKGFAVAYSLKCPLPSNITFFQVVSEESNEADDE